MNLNTDSSNLPDRGMQMRNTSLVISAFDPTFQAQSKNPRYSTEVAYPEKIRNETTYYNSRLHDQLEKILLQSSAQELSKNQAYRSFQIPSVQS